VTDDLRDDLDDLAEDDAGRGIGFGFSLSYRSRLTLGLIAASILPLAGFGIVVLVAGARMGPGETLGRVLLFAIVTATVIAVLLAYLLAADLINPLRAIAAAVDRVSAGDLSTPIEVPGEDELARLADSHNRLASMARSSSPAGPRPMPAARSA
jgi:methyl-accepting chemotaxis protein